MRRQEVYAQLAALAIFIGALLLAFVAASEKTSAKTNELGPKCRGWRGYDANLKKLVRRRVTTASLRRCVRPGRSLRRERTTRMKRAKTTGRLEAALRGFAGRSLRLFVPMCLRKK